MKTIFQNQKPSRSPFFRAARGFSIFIFFCLVLPAPASANGTAKNMPWIVDARTAKTLVDDGATLLDARGRWAYTRGHLDGAVRIAWDDFTPSPRPDRGELLSDDARLEKKLEKLGVDNGKPVVVVDDPKDGWGEAGRIVWMLRTLGHDKAAWVDGGHDALAATGIDTTLLPVEPRKSSGFDISRTNDFRADISRVKASLGDEETVFVDTREPREFEGGTPYGEKRGGHLPGAKHLWFKELLDEDGTLKPTSELKKLLASKGITPDKRVIAYCTGGVRSGWFTGVLHHIGYDKAANYAGSMWEWSNGKPAEYPLEK